MFAGRGTWPGRVALACEPCGSCATASQLCAPGLPRRSGRCCTAAITTGSRPWRSSPQCGASQSSSTRRWSSTRVAWPRTCPKASLCSREEWLCSLPPLVAAARLSRRAKKRARPHLALVLGVHRLERAGPGHGRLLPRLLFHPGPCARLIACMIAHARPRGPRPSCVRSLAHAQTLGSHARVSASPRSAGGRVPAASARGRLGPDEPAAAGERIGRGRTSSVCASRLRLA